MVIDAIVPPTEGQLINDQSSAKREITALELTLTQDLVITDRDLIVWVDKLKIAGKLRAPGRKIAIFARQLVCEGAVIEVSGGEGQPSYEPGNTPPPAGNPGENGRNGKDADEGEDAGAVYITAQKASGNLRILANGGTGGRAQDGGNAAPGKNGANGADARPQHRVGRTNGTAGQPGGKGGDAGAAGTSGAGGKGGKIVVAIVDNTALQLETSANGGKGGAPAAHGKAGPGGKGGKGGENIKEDYETVCN